MQHNLSYEENAPEFVQERNKQLLEAYKYSLVTIKRIQGFLEDEHLRTCIESDMYKMGDVRSTIYQCTTPWCILSIGCDEMGRYNIIYSIDHRAQDMIGTDSVSTLIRRINEFTPGAMEPFVKIGCLYEDCVAIYNELIGESKINPNHKIVTTNKHDTK